MLCWASIADRLCTADSGQEAEVGGQAFGSTREEQSEKWGGGVGDFSWVLDFNQPLRSWTGVIWAGHREVSLSCLTWLPIDLFHRKPGSQKAWVQLPNAGDGGEVQRCLSFLVCEMSTKLLGDGKVQCLIKRAGIEGFCRLHLLVHLLISACISGGYCILAKVIRT